MLCNDSYPILAWDTLCPALWLESTIDRITILDHSAFLGAEPFLVRLWPVTRDNFTNAAFSVPSHHTSSEFLLLD